MSTPTPAGAPAPPPAKNRSRARVRGAVLAFVVVIAIVTAGVALVRSRSGTDEAVPGDGASQSATASTSPSPSPTTSKAPTRSPSTASPSGTAAPATTFRFLPLWPFASVADAAAWQREALPGGHQPWRLDPGLTALSFATSYLGYTEMDRVTSRQVVGDEAWIGVAGSPPEGRTVPAAVLHVARIGVGPLAQRPWEVVGSRDTSLTLTTPRYGSTVGTTFRVGGRITGVDESLVVQVRDHEGGLLARSGGIPAGGEATPWELTMTVKAAGGLATVAVSTGGHVAQVELFAITAVKIRSVAPRR